MGPTLATRNRLRTEDDLDRLRTRWSDPDFAAARDHQLRQADEALRLDLRPVDEAGGWGHAFHCPDHVVPLEFDPAGPAQHRCPVDGKLWQGEDFDSGWRCTLNALIQRGIQACATVYAAVGPGDGDKYLQYAREILLDYADRYPGMPEYGRWVGKGRITGQSLEEAVWANGACRAYDVIRNALSDDDQQRIERSLLRELADHLTGQLMGKIHNIECWHLAALANLGVVLDDEKLITLAVDGDFGLSAQLAEGILEDGWWAEGSPSYHYYMLSAALSAATALRDRRPDFLATRGLKDMLMTPLTMIRSDFSLPATNDGWNSVAQTDGLAQYRDHYEQGYGLWPDPRFVEVLAALYARGAERVSEAALSVGPDLRRVSPPTSWPLRPVHPASGYAILTSGSGGDQRYLMVKYGPHGGGHGHPDKLELDLHAYGVNLAPDAGSPAYTSKLQGPWVRQTLSHNTVLLDHTSQPEAEGSLINFCDPAEHAFGLADVEVSWPTDPDAVVGRQGSWLKEPRRTFTPAYAGAHLRRSVLWTERYFIDLVRVSAPYAMPIELAWHHRGSLIHPTEVAPVRWEPPNETYGFLTDVNRLSHEGRAWQAAWELEGVSTRMWAHDPEEAQVLVAQSPSNPPAELQSTVLRRVHGSSAQFAAVIEVAQDDQYVESVTWSPLDDGLSVAVQHRDGVDTWHFPTDGVPLPERSSSTLE